MKQQIVDTLHHLALPGAGVGTIQVIDGSSPVKDICTVLVTVVSLFPVIRRIFNRKK